MSSDGSRKSVGQESGRRDDDDDDDDSNCPVDLTLLPSPASSLVPNSFTVSNVLWSVTVVDKGESDSQNYHHYYKYRGKKIEFTAFKLMADPALTEGTLRKLYRYDGKIPGESTGSYSFKNLAPVDPRNYSDFYKNKNNGRKEPLTLPVMNFKIDANFVGVIPTREITFTNLSENVTEIRLHKILLEFGLLSKVMVCVHPVSHRHLRFGHAVFKRWEDAKRCMEKLNRTLLMGQTVNLCFDKDQKICNDLFIKATTQLPGTSSSSSSGTNN